MATWTRWSYLKQINGLLSTCWRRPGKWQRSLNTEENSAREGREMVSNTGANAWASLTAKIAGLSGLIQIGKRKWKRSQRMTLIHFSNTDEPFCRNNWNAYVGVTCPTSNEWKKAWALKAENWPSVERISVLGAVIDQLGSNGKISFLRWQFNV